MRYDSHSKAHRLLPSALLSNLNMWFFFLVTLLFSQSPLLAAPHAGDIIKFEGKVLLFKEGKVRGELVVQENTPFFVHDSIKTKSQSTCFIQFIDKSKIVLKENSSLTVKGIDHANIDKGAVLFDIKKRGQVKGLNITSATITIGVKGTRFAVYKRGGELTVYLQEGLLELASEKVRFKHYGESLKQDHEEFSRKLRDDFEASKEKLRSDFEESKRLMQEGNIQFLKSFEMTAGSAISIDENNEVWNINIPEWVEEDFSLLDKFDQ